MIDINNIESAYKVTAILIMWQAIAPLFDGNISKKLKIRRRTLLASFC